MKILVTGGEGFIGTNLCNLLVDRGHKVFSMENFPKQIKITKAIRMSGDVRHYPTLSQSVKGMDVVVHLAAHSGVLTSIEDPLHDYESNTLGTFNLCLACSRVEKPPKIIFASSGGAILGNAPTPFREDQHCMPLSPYGASKLCGEAYLSAYSGSFGINAIALRFSNIYGTYSHLKENVISKFIKHAFLKKRPFYIYGDGLQTRDFLHVEDLIIGIESAIIKDIQGFNIINMSTMKQTTINYVIGKIQSLLHEKMNIYVPIEYTNRRSGEVYLNFASNKKAKRLLDFIPKINIEDGLERTVDWFINNKRIWLTGEECQ